MNPETEVLQTQISRLNVIISVLVEKNQQLEQEIALLTGKPKGEKMISILPQNLQSSLNSSDSLVQSLHIPEEQNNSLTQNLDRQELNKNALSKNLDGIEVANNNHPHTLDRQQLMNLGLVADVNTLYSLLKKEEMLKVGNNGVLNIAKALKVLAETDRPAYPDIRRQTGQGDSGISKMIRSMKKRNLLVRTSQHKFHLTEKAIAFLREAGGK